MSVLPAAATIAARAASFDDEFSRQVLNYYRQQQSGAGAINFPVYQGAEYQYGRGFGDFFRSIGRFILPIIAPMASRFVQSAASGLSEGQSLRQAAKSAISPTLSEGLTQTVGQIKSKFGQSGSGRGQQRRRRQQPKRNAKRATKSNRRPRTASGKNRKGSRSLVYKKAISPATLRFLQKTNF